MTQLDFVSKKETCREGSGDLRVFLLWMSSAPYCEHALLQGRGPLSSGLNVHVHVYEMILRGDYEGLVNRMFTWYAWGSVSTWHKARRAGTRQYSQRQEEQEFNVILSYLLSLRPAP